MQKWEYLQLETVLIHHDLVWMKNGSILGKATTQWSLNNRPIVEFINQLGEEGWELVSAVTFPGRILLFKRPIQ